MNSSKHEILRDLARRIQQIESGRRHPRTDGAVTGIAAMDALLPPDGLVRGAFVELLAAADGAGAWTLGIVMAAHICHKRKTSVIVDADRQIYFPGAVRLGLELNRSIVVHPDSRRDAYQAIVQSLRSRAVGAVLSWQERLSMRELRRLQVAAEAGGGAAILLRPAGALRVPSCAPVRLLVSPVGSPEPGPFLPPPNRLSSAIARRHFSACEPFPDRPWVRHVRVEVVRCRGRASGQSLVLEIDDETGHVRAPASVAPATIVARSARASG